MRESTTSGPARWLRRLETPGLSPRRARLLNVLLALLLAVFATGWAVAVTDASRAGRPLGVGAELAPPPLGREPTPSLPYLLGDVQRQAEAGPWRGRSGAVRVVVTDPGDTVALPEALGLDSVPRLARLELRPARDGVDDLGDAAGPAGPAEAGSRGPASGPPAPGTWDVLVRVRDQARQLTGVSILAPVPSEQIRAGRLGRYLIGEWPARSARPAAMRTAAYDPPGGLIAVTPENRDLPVSEHLTLGDFLTKGQEDVWPKYVALSPRILDKVELTLQELERSGHPVENVGVISGFRTPDYNVHGGDPSGRGSLSRHMYGDALDFYIDNDGDGAMDDLDGDGRITVADARIIADAAERVEAAYPEYIGGIGVYRPNPGAHAGFVHLDARGTRARW